MTLAEALVALGVILFGILFPVAALVMGYGLLWALLALPIGIVVGMGCGVASNAALQGPINRSIERQCASKSKE